MKSLFITGIGTGVGKTIVSAVLTEKLKADYWKPVQSGDLDNSDTNLVISLVYNTLSRFHPEAYRLTQPYSPHKSADLDGIIIDPSKFVLPSTKNQLIIEGAGGLMVPLNDDFLMIDLIKQLDAEVILVSKNYLGSINHTLMSAGILQAKGIKMSKLIFCGDRDTYSESFIKSYLNVESLHIPQFRELNADLISEFTEGFNW